MTRARNVAKTPIPAAPQKKAPPATKPKEPDDVLTTLARELVDELEKTELRRWDGWMDQMLQ